MNFDNPTYSEESSKQSSDDGTTFEIENERKQHKRSGLGFRRQRNADYKPHSSKAVQVKYRTYEETSYNEPSCFFRFPSGSSDDMSNSGTNDENDNDLHQLAVDGDEKKMQKALDKLSKPSKPVNAEINRKDKYHRTLLHYAAENKHVEMCKLLVENGADVNLCDENNKTALHLVVDRQKEMNLESIVTNNDENPKVMKINQIVKLLLRNDARVNVRDINNCTPLYYVSQYGLATWVKPMMEKNKTIQACDGQKRTPLHVAAIYGHVEVAKEFSEYGAVILTSWTQQLAGIFRNPQDRNQSRLSSFKELLDMKDKYRFTPLHYTAKYKHVGMCRWLVDRGADVNACNSDDSTALHITLNKHKEITPDPESLSHTSKENRNEMFNEMSEIVKLLLDGNASVDNKDDDGRTPLHCAAQIGHVACAKLLLKKYKGSNKNQRDSNQSPLLHVKQLLDMKDKNGLTALHYAAKYKQDEMCTLLLMNGADINICDNNSRTAIHLIIDENLDGSKLIDESNIKFLEHILDQNMKCNLPNVDSCKPLHYASLHGSVSCVKLLIDKYNKSVNAADKRHQTPLHIAAEYGHMDVATLLIKKKADVRFKDINNRTPLHLAAAEGKFEIVTLILETCSKQRRARFVDILDERDNDGNTPLHLAVDNGHLLVTQLIINSCSEERLHKVLKAYRKTKETPLHLASRYGHIEIVRFLVEKGAKVNEHDENSLTPLILASQFNHYKVAEFLHEKSGANTELFVWNGLSALLAAASRGHEETIKVILNKQNYGKDGPKLPNTPLHLAAEGGHFSAVQRLLSAGAEIDVKNEHGQTPFHLAAQNGHLNIVQEFYDRKHEIVQHTDANENTPLHLAALKGKIQVVQKLVQLGAKFWARNAEQQTPLDCCAAAGMHKSAEALLRAGCPPDPKDRSKTPLHLACQGGHTEMVRVLLQWKADVTHRSESGWNALDFAIDSGNDSCARLIIEDKSWRKALKNGVIDNKGKVETPMRKLIQKMPDIAKKVFTKCMKEDDKEVDEDHAEYKIKFDYELLDDEFSCRNWCEEKQDEKSSSSSLGKVRTALSGDFLPSKKKNVPRHKVYDKKGHMVEDAIAYTKNSSLVKENHPLNIMVEAKRKMLLRHPLVVSLLNHKWRAYGRAVYSFNLLLYLIFMGIFNSYMLTMPPPYSIVFTDSGNVTSSCVAIITEAQPEYGPCYNYNSWGIIAKPFVILLSVVSLLKELFQVKTQQFSYFLSFTNFCEVSLYVLAILTVYSDTSSAGPNYFGIREDWQWQVGAVSIFLSWMVLIMFTRNVPTFGIYVLMFNHVLRTFTKFFVVFVLFIFGFALSFHCLLQNQYAFRQWWVAVIKTSIMMIGEFQFEDIFLSEVDAIETGADNHTITVSTVNYRGVTYSLFTLFLIVMSIIIMNLLVGLAVDDIKTVQENAKLKRLEMQVKLTLYIEYRLPQSIRCRFMRKHRKFQPNKYNKSPFLVKWFNSEDNLEPSTIKEAINSEKTEHEKQVKHPEQKAESMDGKVESLDGKVKSLDQNVRSIKEKLLTLDRSMESKISAIMSHFNIDVDGNEVTKL